MQEHSLPLPGAQENAGACRSIVLLCPGAQSRDTTPWTRMANQDSMVIEAYSTMGHVVAATFLTERQQQIEDRKGFVTCCLQGLTIQGLEQLQPSRRR